MKVWMWGITLTLMAVVSAAGTAQAQIVGRLAGIRGTVEVNHGRQPTWRVASSTVLQSGDIVTVRAGGSADLFLDRTKGRYRLAPESRVRVQKTALQLLSGGQPQLLSAHNGPNLSRALFEARGLGEVVRTTGRDPRFGPREPSPLFARRSWDSILRWSGPLDPVTLQDGDIKLHVRIRTLDGAKTVLSEAISPEKTELHVPEGTLRPGTWYVWSVMTEGARSNGQTCGGPLLLLSDQEQIALKAAENEAEQASRAHPRDAKANQRLAEIYERFGMVPEALLAYETAQRLQPDAQNAQLVARLSKLVNGK